MLIGTPASEPGIIKKNWLIFKLQTQLGGTTVLNWPNLSLWFHKSKSLTDNEMK